MRTSRGFAGAPALRYDGYGDRNARHRAGEAGLIPRYTRAEMGRVWSDANKYAKWLEVELAATETLAEAGVVPKDVAVTLRARAKADAGRLHDIESRVQHDR